MAFAQGSRSSLSFGVQSDFQTAATAPFTDLPFKTHSLDVTKGRLGGQDIQADRMSRIDRHGNRQAGGSLEVDLRKGDYDAILEAMMFNAFDANDELKVGTTPSFLTIEDAANDISQFRLFTGMGVNSGTFSIAPEQMVNTTFEFVGRDGAQSDTSSAGTVNPNSGNQPFDSFKGEIYEGGVGTGDLITSVTSIEFSVNNSLAPTFVVGSPIAPQLEFGRAVVEGTLTAYYEDAALIQKFLDEEESVIEVSVDDPTGNNSYTFLLPRVKYNGGTVGVPNEQSRTIELPFVALRDTVEETNLKITRPAST